MHFLRHLQGRETPREVPDKSRHLVFFGTGLRLLRRMRMKDALRTGQLQLLTDIIRLHVKDAVYTATRLDLIKSHGDVVHGAAGSGFAVRTASVGMAMNDQVGAVTVHDLS